MDETRSRKDFRLTHPLFGQVFRYAGVFEARALVAGDPEVEVMSSWE